MEKEQLKNIEDEMTPEPEKAKRRVVEYTDEYRDAIIRFYREVSEEFPEKRSDDESKYVPKLSPEDPNSNYWLALNKDNEIDGTLSLRDFGENVGYVSMFYVKKGKRGGLVGGRLIKAMDQFAKEKGYKKLFAVTMPGNEDAQKMYGKRMKRVDSPPSNKYPWHEGTVFFEMDLDNPGNN